MVHERELRRGRIYQPGKVLALEQRRGLQQVCRREPGSERAFRSERSSQRGPDTAWGPGQPPQRERAYRRAQGPGRRRVSSPSERSEAERQVPDAEEPRGLQREPGDLKEFVLRSEDVIRIRIFFNLKFIL